MHTPSHALVNIATLGSVFGHEGAVLLGALLPDLPILTLYLYERLRGTPEEIIWSVCYQPRLWLGIIHGAHSIPLAAIGIALGWLLSMPALAVFFASVLLHALCDFPVHAIDAHHHFLPFSQYRYISPLSYWDVRYHARQVAGVELLLVLISSCYIVFTHLARWPRGARPLAVVGLFVVNLGYAHHYWRHFLRARSDSASA